VLAALADGDATTGMDLEEVGETLGSATPAGLGDAHAMTIASVAAAAAAAGRGATRTTAGGAARSCLQGRRRCGLLIGP
jgi:hypothetical protein